MAEETVSPGSFEARRASVYGALSDPTVRTSTSDPTLRSEWLDKPRREFNQAVEINQRRGRKNALVIQYADGILSYDGSFINSYLSRFGAHVLARDGNRIDANSWNLSEIVSVLPTVEYDLDSNYLDQIPNGGVLVVESRRLRDVIFETDIEGVKIMADGLTGGRFRPRLLVRIDDAPRLNLRLPEDEEAEKKLAQTTFKELHGREITKISGLTEHEEKQFGPQLIKGSEQQQQRAQAGLAWGMEAKSADEIRVTPTKLKEDPSLKNEQERLDNIKQALDMAVDNLKLTQRGLGRNVVGAMTYGLVVLTEVLGMTPEEIIKDGEAMADLVEYLEEAACARITKSTGHTQLIGPPPPGDPFTEIAKKIKDTWEFPQNTPFSNFPFMYQRINWKNRAGQQAQNN